MRFFHGTEERRRSIGSMAAIRVALTIGLTMGISLVASAARAQTITACVNNKNGAVSVTSKGSCPKNTHAVVLNPPPSPTLTVQRVNIVDASNKTLTSVGPTSDGNVLTFFDSGGHKTLTVGNNASESAAGATAWDNNKVIPGAGVPRLTWGEANPNVGPNSGFGVGVYDGNGNALAKFGPVYDLSANAIFFVGADGRSAGVGLFQTGFDGYFANDANGVTRQFGGLPADGTNVWGESDPNGVVRVSAAQVPPDFVNQKGGKGNAFAIWDPNGLQQVGMGAFTDGSLAGFDVVDPNNIVRLSAFLTPQNGMNVDTRDQNGNVTGHLP